MACGSLRSTLRPKKWAELGGRGGGVKWEGGGVNATAPKFTEFFFFFYRVSSRGGRGGIKKKEGERRCEARGKR